MLLEVKWIKSSVVSLPHSSGKEEKGKKMRDRKCKGGMRMRNRKRSEEDNIENRDEVFVMFSPRKKKKKKRKQY